jgi:putative transcriptional regulator
MVRCHLAVLLAKKKWNQSDLQRATGIRYNTINDLYHEFALGIRFDHMDKICKVLGCKGEDLIEYIPDKSSRKKKLT